MSTIPPRPVTLDVRALVDPVDRGAVRAPRRTLRQHARDTRTRPSTSVVVQVLGLVLRVVLVAFLVAVAALCATAVYGFLAFGLTALGAGRPLVVLVLAAVTALVVLLVVRGARRASQEGRELAYRLSRFAAANVFDVDPRVEEPELPSGAFHLGILRVARNVVRTGGRRPVEVATYTYSAGYRNGEPFAFTYAMVALDRTLPRVVVETMPARGLRGARAPRGVERVWELPVDGPFGDRHRAYGPVRSPAGTARAVFTPEIVETLVRGPLPLAAEVSGDRLFLFSEHALDLLDPAVWERLLGTATDLAARLSRTDGPGGPGAAPGIR
ncbi:hypothetical protein ACFVTZ_04730 [Cellulosimicrobium cellulans]|uniref:hypothetical protein n=1 Tax=Cellulosimicrobium cellulans TaxID=1710 RepID=UPI0036E3DA2B